MSNSPAYVPPKVWSWNKENGGQFPPPRFPLQRLSGVFGPRSPLRAAVVPRGPTRAGATATLPCAKKTKQKKRIAKMPNVPSPFGASGEGTLPERGSDGEKAVRSPPRTSLGDSVVKPGGRRIEWAQLLLRRVDWVDASVAMVTIPREGMNTLKSAVQKCHRQRRALR
jgi:hypothetical protein